MVAVSRMSWLVAPAWTYGGRGRRRRSSRSGATSGMTGLPPSGGVGQHGVDVEPLDPAGGGDGLGGGVGDLRRRRPGPRPAPPRRRASPGATPGADVAAADGTAGRRGTPKASDQRRRRTHRHLGGGCRDGSSPGPDGAATSRCRRSGPTTGRAGSVALAAVLVAEVDAGHDPVEQAAGEDRHDQVRRLGRAVAASATPAASPCARPSAPSASEPRSQRVERPRSACHVSITPSGTGAPSPSRSRPRIEIAPGSRRARLGCRRAGSARTRWRNGPTVCDGVRPGGGSGIGGSPRTAWRPGPAPRCRSGSRAPTRARSRRGRSRATSRGRAAGSGIELKIGSWKNSGSSGKYIWVTSRCGERPAEHREVDVGRAPGVVVVAPRVGAGADRDEAVACRRRRSAARPPPVKLGSSGPASGRRRWR